MVLLNRSEPTRGEGRRAYLAMSVERNAASSIVWKGERRGREETDDAQYLIAASLVGGDAEEGQEEVARAVVGVRVGGGIAAAGVSLNVRAPGEG